jgi:hypothetical protein
VARKATLSSMPHVRGGGRLCSSECRCVARYVKQSVRGDWNCWADPSDEHCPAPLKDWITHLDAFVLKVAAAAAALFLLLLPFLLLLLLLLLLSLNFPAQVLDRLEETKAVEVQRGSSMMTCYPGNNARYIRCGCMPLSVVISPCSL